jgi:UDP-N-acetylmuramoylalanine--D-glutamate ligase
MKNVLLPGHVAILGFARSGRSLARALLQRGVGVSIGDAKPESAFPDAEEWRHSGARLFFDGPSSEFLEDANWLILSPGVPRTGSLVREAEKRGMSVWGELEIAWRLLEKEAEAPNQWIAVTGTNGKSTTTAWIAEILRRAGRPVALAGNIGTPLSDFLDSTAPRTFVCEVSSFQLESIERFHAQVGVVTNVTPDHLDRYETLSEYAAAKEKVFWNQTTRDFAVVNADDPLTARMAARGRRVPFSRRSQSSSGVWMADGWLRSDVRGGPRDVLPVASLALSGAHNLENALAALAAADCAGAPEKAIQEGLSHFHGLRHRTELVAEADGVRWIDDSKGTNIDATKKSLEGFGADSVILILGGRDKHGDFAALGPAVREAVRLVLTIGEAAGVVERALANVVTIERAETMERAVARARRIARSGDTVLLSPACASFDQYRNFEERGDHFAALARAAVEAAHGA